MRVFINKTLQIKKNGELTGGTHHVKFTYEEG